MPRIPTRRTVLCLAALPPLPAGAAQMRVPSLPDPLIAAAYEKAAGLNVLAARNDAVFPGYFSVCADGLGYGYGNSYPSLDGHQMTDALVWLGAAGAGLRNFDYVRSFQRADGSLPLAILPGQAGKAIGPAGYTATVDANGGLYRHWVPGNPLAALAAPTYIQNADVLFRRTLDREWLAARIDSIDRAADSLAGLVTPEGAVRGAGYYVERPTRFDCDGVAQTHAVDAFRRVAALNRVLGEQARAARYEGLAGRIRHHFIARFWRGDRFAEYRHPEHGWITRHGFTDSDWAALAFDCASPPQRALLWPRLRGETRFYYGGMPSGIATEPGKYEAWEFAYPDRQDLAAMGRVWYLEARARARMGDSEGLFGTILRVCRAGREAGWHWRERYGEKGGYGVQKYCEYPANLIRILHRFALGSEPGLDGGMTLAPAVPERFWKEGFGEEIEWGGRRLAYRFEGGRLTGSYSGAEPSRLRVRAGVGRHSVALPAARLHRFAVRL